MRIAAAAIVLFALRVLALPASKYLADRTAIDGENDEFSFTFTGPVVVGGPNVTLAGSAKSLYYQVIELNPNYEADFAVNTSDAENATTSLSPSSIPDIQRRDDTVERVKGLDDDPDYGPQHGTWDCDKGDKMVRGAAGACTEGFNYLQKLGNAACGAKAHQRVRVSCSHKCSMIYHNLRHKRHTRPCIDIRNDLMRVFNKCSTRQFLDQGWDVKGRLTRPDGEEYVEIQRETC